MHTEPLFLGERNPLGPEVRGHCFPRQSNGLLGVYNVYKDRSFRDYYCKS